LVFRCFDTWRTKDIHILGFNQLKNNKLNEYKAEINIEVLSGTDWFETHMKVSFGKQKVALNIYTSPFAIKASCYPG
jgi:hypothetical protein